MLRFPLQLPRINDVRFVLTPICFIGRFMFFYFFLFTHTGVQHDFHVR